MATKTPTKKAPEKKHAEEPYAFRQDFFNESYKKTREWFIGIRPSIIETPKLPPGAKGPWRFVPLPGRIVGGVSFVYKSNPVEVLEEGVLRTSVDKPGHFLHLTYPQLRECLELMHRHVASVQLANKADEYGAIIPWRSRSRPPLSDEKGVYLRETDVPLSMFAVVLPRLDDRVPVTMDYLSMQNKRAPSVAELEPDMLRRTQKEYEFDPEVCPWLPDFNPVE